MRTISGDAYYDYYAEDYEDILNYVIKDFKSYIIAWDLYNNLFKVVCKPKLKYNFVVECIDYANL